MSDKGRPRKGNPAIGPMAHFGLAITGILGITLLTSGLLLAGPVEEPPSPSALQRLDPGSKTCPPLGLARGPACSTEKERGDRGPKTASEAASPQDTARLAGPRSAHLSMN